MFEFNALFEILAFSTVVFSLCLSKNILGGGIDNIPLWNGLGVAFLLACYALLGINFSNGTSVGAELLTGFLILVNTLFFYCGKRIAIFGKSFKSIDYPVRNISGTYTFTLGMLTVIFYFLLTQGDFWRLISDSVGLKFERLYGIAEKSPILINLDAIVLAMTMIAFTWSILIYRDDFSSRVRLLGTACLIFLYVQSTGSRSPLIMVAMQALPALLISKKYSKDICNFLKNKKLFILLISLGFTFMILTTANRMEFEGLDEDVFSNYFQIDNFGLLKSTIHGADSASFFLSTIIIYAASTFNNLVIRVQEIGMIDPSMGYKFLFPYIAASQILLPDLFGVFFGTWKDIGSRNNDLLLSISDNAGQWATPYGDLIWDFGLYGAVIVTAIISIVAGYLIGKSIIRPTFENVLLKTIIIGFSILPLVNPLLSLYVHYEILVIFILYLTKSKK